MHAAMLITLSLQERMQKQQERCSSGCVLAAASETSGRRAVLRPDWWLVQLSPTVPDLCRNAAAGCQRRHRCLLPGSVRGEPGPRSAVPATGLARGCGHVVLYGSTSSSLAPTAISPGALQYYMQT